MSLISLPCSILLAGPPHRPVPCSSKRSEVRPNPASPGGAQQRRVLQSKARAVPPLRSFRTAELL